ncbi:hypothetical protein H6P81_007494 [Aristolochia fimbriata]|uniref:Uncharacterized protein n=1 Tax=Aristolochia fimbriata TaxID=158543 RepID=A0AAV7F0F9_ARIFI|nr:hypothetical protein H6P81_007494 [Aristolochia fimbriata]
MANMLAFHLMAEENKDVVSTDHGLDFGRLQGRVMMSGAADYNPKISWPEVVGLKVEKAKEIIRGDLGPASESNFVLIPEGSFVTMDFQMSRIRIFVDASGQIVVDPPPAVG